MNKKVIKPYLSSSLKGTYWIGVVKDDADPLGASRIRVSIPRLTDKIPVNDLPWYVLHSAFGSQGNASATIPPIDSRVRVTFINDDIYSGVVVANIVSIPPAKV